MYYSPGFSFVRDAYHARSVILELVMSILQPLKNDELNQAMRQLDVNWSAIPGKGLIRIVPTDNFTTGFALLAKIAGLADQQNHHPEITLRYSEIEITIITHAVGDITRADLLLAKEIDQLLEAKP